MKILEKIKSKIQNFIYFRHSSLPSQITLKLNFDIWYNQEHIKDSETYPISKSVCVKSVFKDRSYFYSSYTLDADLYIECTLRELIFTELIFTV